MVFEEVEVVRRAERQLLLEVRNLPVELLIGFACLHLLLLHHLVLLGGEVTNLTNELCEPRLLGELGVVIEEMG